MKFALLAPHNSSQILKKKKHLVVIHRSALKHKKQHLGDMNRKAEQLWGAKEQTSNGIATITAAASA